MIINSENSLESAKKEIDQLYKDNKYIEIKVLKGRQRTLTQNKAIHKYFEMLADALNDGGYTIAKVITKPLELSWSKHTVKEILWRTVQKAILDKESTTKLERAEVSKVYDELNNIMSARYGINVRFPDAHEQ